MIEEIFDRGNAQDWERFFEGFRADSFKENASFDELHFLLSMMADYDRNKFDQYVFNSAFNLLENVGVTPSNDVTLLDKVMRERFLEVSMKIYSFFRENNYKVRLEVREDSHHRPIGFEFETYNPENECLSENQSVCSYGQRSFDPYIC